MLRFSSLIRPLGYSLFLALFFIVAGSGSSEACTPKIVHKQDINIPSFIEEGTEVVFQWEVQNQSSCDAVDLRLGFYSANPSSSTADFGGNGNPSFSLAPWEKGIIEARMPKAPGEVGTYFEIKFDLLKSDGTPLNPLALGRLGAEFTIIPSVTPPPPQDCTAELTWSEPKFDGGELAKGASAQFLWFVTNTSTDCDAVDYHLGFKSADPASPTADYAGMSHPRFTLLNGESGMVQATIL
ncbi:MAG: hypothetical protein D3905_14900, partial [Candidatus Electrothrix sp. AS4_5]|nr:hypothetical protein [Candidatus Electrothrix gigas]